MQCTCMQQMPSLNLSHSISYTHAGCLCFSQSLLSNAAIVPLRPQNHHSRSFTIGYSINHSVLISCELLMEHKINHNKEHWQMRIQ